MRVSRTTGAVSGLAIVALGVWGGLIPFIGPYFNYAIGPNVTWHYAVHRLWLDILPGGVAVLGGLMIINARSRIDGTFGSWLALAAGVWFAVGPPISRLWDAAATAASPIGAPYGGTNHQILELVGYYYGVGALLVGFAAFSLGRFVTRPALAAGKLAPLSLAAVRAAEERRVSTPPVTAPPVTAPPVSTPPVSTPPVTAPPVTTPPVTAPPVTAPPVTAPSATDQPDVDHSEVDHPEADQPEADQPDVDHPEVDHPVAEEPEGEQPTTVQEPETAHRGVRE